MYVVYDKMRYEVYLGQHELLCDELLKNVNGAEKGVRGFANLNTRSTVLNSSRKIPRLKT